VRKRIFIISVLSCLASGILAQEALFSSRSIRERQQELSELKPDESRRLALEYVRKNNLPERIKYKNGTVLEIRRLSPTGLPMYYKTFNLNAAKTVSSESLWSGGGAGLDLSGNGIVVGVWDAGSVRTSHKEFEGRARRMNPAAEVDFHATHVAGTIGAGGIKSGAHGMAHESTIESYDWINDNEEMRNAAENGLLISNHSYGFVHGWEYDYDLERWEWWGDEGISSREDYNFGFYGSEARVWDDIAYDNSRFLIVKSAGNDRGDGPASGASHYVYSGGSWRQSTAVRDLDGGTDGYDCIGTQGTSKNILTVGAVDDIPGGYESPSDVKLASFSAIGPTDDGRIKPDILANGISLYSTSDDSDLDYGYSSGTSMSSPSAAGSLSLLQEYYHDLQGEFMFSSQLKALVLHTADEAGNVGPDYKYGWGLMNTARAAEIISSIPDDRFFYGVLEDQEVEEFTFFSRGDEEIRITMVWTDQPGVVSSAQLNPTNGILVNDLDIRLNRSVDDHQYRPWVLDPANPSKAAQTGDNVIDNVEQIYISQPVAGFYTLQISHKSSLPAGTGQAYAIIITGLKQDYIASGYNVLEEANGSILLSSADEYMDNMEVQWLIKPENDLPVSFYFDFFETEENRDFLTIYDGADTTALVLASFSGTPVSGDTLITSTSDEMFITFTSDDQNTEKGFLAKYCTVAPEGEYSIEGEAFPCEFGTFSYFSMGQEGADYQWFTSEGWSWQQKTYNGIDLSVGGTTGTLSVTPVNRCGVGNKSVLSIQPQNSTPLIEYLSGDTLPCAGWSSQLYVNNLPGVSYQWDLPDSWVGTSESDTLFFVSNSESGTVSVSGMNACGLGNEVSIEVSVLNVPESPGILTEKVPPCAFTTQNFYVNALSGYTYLWEAQDDWKIIGDAELDIVSVEIGASEAFLFLTAVNQCGEKQGNRLFLTSPVPPDAMVNMYNGDKDLPEIEVTNMRDFESIQWYRNGEAISGESGTSNPLVVNLNGLYGVETISDEGCRNTGSETSLVTIDQDELGFLAYRIDESTIIIENTTGTTVDYNLVSLAGQVMMLGKASPGQNEVSFTGRGIFLFWFSGGSADQKYKVLF